MRHSDSTIKSDDTMEAYLREKYNQDFSYLSEGNDVWSSKAKTRIYADQSGNRFRIKYIETYYTDNYASVLFDRTIGQALQSAIGVPCKAAASTESAFFDADARFADVNDYMARCPVINLVLYVPETCDCDEIASALLSAAKGLTASVVIHCVTQTAFDAIGNGETEPMPSEVLSSDSFWLEHDAVSEATWRRQT